MNAYEIINVRVAPLLARIDALSLRERMLVIVTAVVVIVAFWQMTLMEPIEQRAARSRVELDGLKKRISSAHANMQEQILQIAGEGGSERQRIASLQHRIDEINVTLGNYAAELIDPAEMAQVLEGILREQSQLTLLQIRNTTPEPLSDEDELDPTTFYRHGLEIEVEGSYAACLSYLTEIESLPWRLYWQILEIEVIDYPLNRIRLEVSTLSLDEEWIGA